VIKAYIERQRDEQQALREQELLNKKHTRDEPSEAPVETVSPVAEFLDNLHPVNLIGWGCGLAAVIVLGFGLMGLLDYNTEAIKSNIVAQRDEQVSSFYVFTHFGILPWIKTLYGVATLVTVYLFLQRKLIALKMLSVNLRLVLVFIPLYLVISFVSWIMQPIPHSIGGYFVEIINIIFMTVLFGTPIFLLDRLLKDKRIVSVVRIKGL
jgi:hypothetical protein